MEEMRTSNGSPIWLPPGSGVQLKKREKVALGDNQGRALVETGLLETGTGFEFVCMICGRRERNDQRMPPACTGPNWTDEHPLEPMVEVDSLRPELRRPLSS